MRQHNETPGHASPAFLRYWGDMGLAGKNIVIVGAGIGGLAAALCLRRLGAEVTVLEQAEVIREVGAGLQISPNGVAVLRALGLEEHLAGDAVRAKAVILRDFRQGAQVLRLDLARLISDQAYYFVHRADLIDLLAGAARDAGVRVRLLQKVETIESDGGTGAVVHLANGAKSGADLVVGADGLHSKVRQSLNAEEKPFFTGQVAWRAIVPNDQGLVPDAAAQVFMGPGRHLVCYPLRGGDLVNLVAVIERSQWAAEGWAHVDDPANLRAAFAGFGGVAGQLLDRVGDVGIWGLFRHEVAARWYGPGVAILGDAAHPTLPFMAQGANMALEDAWVLADCLGRNGVGEHALAAYQARRRDRVVRVIGVASGNAWKYHLRPGPVRMAAHLALRLGGAVAPGLMVHQYDWLYGFDVTV